MSNIVQEFEARCREAIRGLRFFDKPVEEMDAESLLVFAGYLARENVRLRDAAEKAEKERAIDWLKSQSPPRWIPVEERMPEPFVRCLIRERIPNAEEATVFGVWRGASWQKHSRVGPILHPSMVSHWMPMPPMPSPPEAVP